MTGGGEQVAPKAFASIDPSIPESPRHSAIISWINEAIPIVQPAFEDFLHMSISTHTSLQRSPRK